MDYIGGLGRIYYGDGVFAYVNSLYFYNRKEDK